MTGHTTTIPPIDKLTLSALIDQLYLSPSAAGPHGQKAVLLLAGMADNTILTARMVRKAFTVDRGHIYIDWQAIAQIGRDLLTGRIQLGTSLPSHPDAGIALVLAAALGTGQITASGIDAIRHALGE